MLEDSSLQNSHVSSIYDNEIYIDLFGGGNKKGMFMDLVYWVKGLIVPLVLTLLQAKLQ